MDLDVNRVTLKSELGVVIDRDTITMDTFNSIVEIASVDPVFREKYQDTLHKGIISVSLDLIHGTKDEVLRTLYGPDAEALRKKYLDPGSSERINPYRCRLKYLVTDLGRYIKNYPASNNDQIKWDIISDNTNPYKLKGYEQRSYYTDLNDYKTLAKMIKDKNYSVIVIHDAEFFHYLVTETDICNVTIIFTSWGETLKFNPERSLFEFKYLKEYYEVEQSRKIELISVQPFDQYLKGESL